MKIRWFHMVSEQELRRRRKTWNKSMDMVSPCPKNGRPKNIKASTATEVSWSEESRKTIRLIPANNPKGHHYKGAGSSCMEALPEDRGTRRKFVADPCTIEEKSSFTLGLKDCQI